MLYLLPLDESLYLMIKNINVLFLRKWAWLITLLTIFLISEYFFDSIIIEKEIRIISIRLIFSKLLLDISLIFFLYNFLSFGFKKLYAIAGLVVYKWGFHELIWNLFSINYQGYKTFMGLPLKIALFVTICGCFCPLFIYNNKN